MASYYFYPYISLTGGADGALDSLDGSVLKDGDAAYVVIPSTRRTYVYTLDADSGATESSPSVISPDSNAGNKRWVLTNMPTNENDVKYFGAIGDGTTDDRDALAAADAGATGYVKYTPGTYKIASDLTLTTPIVFDPGAKFLVATGQTLTLNCPITADISQIFSWGGTGKVLFGAGVVDFVRPEWWGALGDGVYVSSGVYTGTDDSAALQHAINSIGAIGTFKPKLKLMSKIYTYDTTLTLTNQRAVSIEGTTGGYYISSYIGYYADLSTLAYRGDSHGILTSGCIGLTFEKFYLTGNSTALNGIYLTSAGTVFRDITISAFTQTGAGGITLDGTQCNSWYNCSFIGNYYGTYFENGTATNTVNIFYSCVWHSNTYAGHFERRAHKTVILNGTFQGDVGVGTGSAIIVDATQSGCEDSHGLQVIGGYISSINDGRSGWEIEIIGHDNSAGLYQGLIIQDIFWASPGTLSLGQIRLSKTRAAVIDNVKFMATAPIIEADPTGTHANSELIFLNWNSAFTVATDTYPCVRDNTNYAIWWTKMMADQPYGYKIMGDRTIIHQPNPNSSREALSITQDAVDMPFIDFVGTSAASAAKSISTWTNATIKGFVKVEVNGTAGWLPIYNAPTS